MLVKQRDILDERDETTRATTVDDRIKIKTALKGVKDPDRVDRRRDVAAGSQVAAARRDAQPRPSKAATKAKDSGRFDDHKPHNCRRSREHQVPNIDREQDPEGDPKQIKVEGRTAELVGTATPGTRKFRAIKGRRLARQCGDSGSADRRGTDPAEGAVRPDHQPASTTAPSSSAASSPSQLRVSRKILSRQARKLAPEIACGDQGHLRRDHRHHRQEHQDDVGPLTKGDVAERRQDPGRPRPRPRHREGTAGPAVVVQLGRQVAGRCEPSDRFVRWRHVRAEATWSST